MTFSFATCNRAHALEFIRKVYPDEDITDTEESAGPLLDFVEKDIVRIQDPMMHGKKIEVLPGTNWEESCEIREKVIAACKLFHE